MQFTLANLLLMIAVPIVARVLASLGMGIISYVSLNAFVQFIVARVAMMLSGASGAAVGVIAMTGAFDAIALLLSALAVRVSLMALKKLGILNL